MIVGLVTMIVAVVVAVAIIWLVPASPQPVRQNPRLAAERSLVPINAAIQRLGLTSRLQVALGQDGVVRVSGWVRNAAERDSVAAALAQVWPMPAMRISSEQEAVSTANDVLRNFDIKYEPRYDGNGRLTVRGIADTAQNRAAALDAVRAQLPGMAVMGNDIQLAPAVADDLATALADAGLGGIALAWRDRQLQAGASGLDDSQLTELEAVLAHFNATHLGVATIAPTSGQRQYADTVPFGIRSVVGGPAPFIVLDNGSKLLVGGTYKRYRLTAIEDKRLIFDGPRPAIVLR
jgi:type III secretion protein D